MSAASPFIAGYTAAIRAELGVGDDVEFAPEALEAIRRDCAAMQSDLLISKTASGGREAWTARQGGWKSWGTTPREDFPRLAVTLGDDGKIHLSEARS